MHRPMSLMSISLLERRRKKIAEQYRRNIHAHRVADALTRFQQSQQITPVIYNEQETRLKTIQVRFNRGE